MGIKERQEREKKALYNLILEKTQEMIGKEGLDGFNMRSLAAKIEYSQSKIYAIFKNKDALLEVICDIQCRSLLRTLQRLPKQSSPDKAITQLVVKSVDYHARHPYSDHLLTYVCFGPGKGKIPEAFLETEDLFIKALQNLNSPSIRTESEIQVALNTIRCLFIGISTLMQSDTANIDAKQGLEIAESAINTLIRGWKK